MSPSAQADVQYIPIKACLLFSVVWAQFLKTETLADKEPWK